MRKVVYAVTMTLLIAAAPATARNSLAIDGDHDFGTQQQQILADLSEGKRYAEIKPQDLEKVRIALARMDQVLRAHPDLNGLGERERTALFNDQELINTILTQAIEDSRMVCERVKKTGSHRMEPVCKTIAQRRRERESSQDYLRDRPTIRPPREGI